MILTNLCQCPNCGRYNTWNVEYHTWKCQLCSHEFHDDNIYTPDCTVCDDKAKFSFIGDSIIRCDTCGDTAYLLDHDRKTHENVHLGNTFEFPDAKKDMWGVSKLEMYTTHKDSLGDICVCGHVRAHHLALQTGWCISCIKPDPMKEGLIYKCKAFRLVKAVDKEFSDNVKEEWK